MSLKCLLLMNILFLPPLTPITARVQTKQGEHEVPCDQDTDTDKDKDMQMWIQNHCGKRCRMRAGGKKKDLFQVRRGSEAKRSIEKMNVFFLIKFLIFQQLKGIFINYFFMLHFWLAIDWPWCQHSKLTFLNFLHYFRVKTSRYIFFLLTHFICSAS